MKELFIGVMGMIALYVLGRFLYPDINTHIPIQQELIKMEDDE